MHRRSFLNYLGFVSLIGITTTTFGDRPLPPARAENIVGVWIGYLQNNSEFFRLELEEMDSEKRQGDGFLARVSLSGQPRLYRVTGWRFAGPTQVYIPLKPEGHDSYFMYFKGTAHDGNRRNLFLELVDGTSREHLVMYRESNYAKLSDIAKAHISRARNGSVRP